MTFEDIVRAVAGIGISIAFYGLFWHSDLPRGAKPLKENMTIQEWYDTRDVIDMPRPRSRANKLTVLIGIILFISGAIAMAIIKNS